MKSAILLCFTLLLATISQSQKRTFVRVFDENGKKAHKGFLVATSDSSISLQSGKKISEISFNQISVLKLRRSIGNTILISSLLFGTAFAIVGAATADPSAWVFAYSAGEGAAAGFLGGTAMGALAGSLFYAFKKRPVFRVNQQATEWMKVKEQLQEYLPGLESN